MSNEIAKNGELLLYSYDGAKEYIDVFFKDETFWLTQSAMAELFDVKTPAISKHLKNIFEEGELEEDVVISKMETTTQHGAIEGKGSISREEAVKKVGDIYSEFRKKQDKEYMSDFDRETAKYLKGE